MARPRKTTGMKRDGFVNYRIPEDVCEDLNAVCYLLGKSGSEITIIAMKEFLDKYRESIELIKKAKIAAVLTPPINPE